MRTETILVGPRRFVEITHDGSGRVSILVKEGLPPYAETIVDVEMPASEGKAKNAFKPTIKIAENVEVEKL